MRPLAPICKFAAFPTLTFCQQVRRDTAPIALGGLAKVQNSSPPGIAALDRSWQTFLRTHMHYLVEHFGFEGRRNPCRDDARKCVEQAFEFILERSHDDVLRLTEKSRSFYRLACQAYDGYWHHHKEYRSHVLDPHVPNLKRADRLKFHVCELRRAADLVQDQSRQMMTVLLQVIETERAAGET